MEEGSEPKKMVDITTMKMEEYNRRMRDDNRSRLMRPKIPLATKFDVKGHMLNMLNDIPFFGKDHEDAHKHIDEAIEISNYFNILNVTKVVVMLRIPPVTLKEAKKTWLKSLPPRVVTTWDNVRTEYIQ